MKKAVTVVLIAAVPAVGGWLLVQWLSRVRMIVVPHEWAEDVRAAPSLEAKRELLREAAYEICVVVKREGGRVEPVTHYRAGQMFAWLEDPVEVTLDRPAKIADVIVAEIPWGDCGLAIRAVGAEDPEDEPWRVQWLSEAELEIAKSAEALYLRPYSDLPPLR